MELPTAQKNIPAPDYRDRLKSGLNKGTPTAFAAVSKDYTPGITKAPQGDSAIDAAYPHRAYALASRTK